MTRWKDSLLIGVPIIDDQHRKLVASIDELMDACAKGQGRAIIGKILSFVIFYTNEHFADEEKLQLQYAYPDRIVHKRMHAQLISNITALNNEFEQNGTSIALTSKLNKTLIEWLINHIKTEDKKIGEHIRKKA